MGGTSMERRRKVRREDIRPASEAVQNDPITSLSILVAEGKQQGKEE
jgi:hypothetical protein